MISEVFTDGFGRITFREGVIRMEVVSFTSSEPEVRQQLVMTLAAFLKSVQMLQRVASKFEAAEVIRSDSREPPPVILPNPKVPEPPFAISAPPAPAAPRSPNFTEQ
jgi:hypothetical protein